MKNKTFYRITNKEIYDEIQSIKKELTHLNIKTTATAAIVAIIMSIIVRVVV